MQNELYSSRIKDFEVLARQSNPRQDTGGSLEAGLDGPAWQLAGNFTASKSKGCLGLGCRFGSDAGAWEGGCRGSGGGGATRARRRWRALP